MRRANAQRACAGLIAAAFAIAQSPGCGDGAPPPAPAPAAKAAPAGDAGVAAAKASAQDPAAPLPEGRFAASNILVAYRGAERAGPAVVRSKEEAKALAAELRNRIRAGEEFGVLADQYSDGPERGHAGRLGVFTLPRMMPAISRTVAGLQVGEVAEPVESPFGYHLVRRDPVEEIYVAEIVVAFAGAPGAPAGVTRGKDAAAARAAEALAAVRVPGATFADVAAKYSDRPSAANGGVLGRIFRGLLAKPLDDLAFSLGPGEIGGPVEAPHGFVLLRRLREIDVRHVLVSYRGAARAGEAVTRSKEEAAALAGEVWKKIEAGEAFDALALKYSDCPSRSRGGVLEGVAEGAATPRFEAAAFGLAVGERSGVVETEFGFHVMERLR